MKRELSQTRKNIYFREWYRRNRELCAQRQRNYRLRNLEKCKARVRRYQETHKEQARARGKLWALKNRKRLQHQRLKRRYGISLKYYEQILQDQGNKCAICVKSRKRGLFVDHCHITNRVRGLLCSNCNSILGMADEDIRLLKRVIYYIEKSRSVIQ